MYDVIIIGGGPAGLTAAIYTSRRELKTLVLSRDLGGQAAQTIEIENYPGFKHISGPDLTAIMADQAKTFGSEIIFNETKRIERKNNVFTVHTTNNQYQSKSIILAFGRQPKELGVPGEEKYKGRGVSYCTTCDANFFRQKTVTVIGSGDKICNSAILLSKIAQEIYLISPNKIIADKTCLSQVKKIKNITDLSPNKIKKINGDKRYVRSITLESGENIKTDGIFIEIGSVVDRTLVKGLVEINEENQIVTNELQETSVPGVFACGDITTTKYKQIVIAASEGAKAALSCYDYLQKEIGKKGIKGDWQKILKRDKE